MRISDWSSDVCSSDLHGTLPLDDLYFDLKPLSANLGAVDYDALTAGRPQETVRNPYGRFRLYRIGDAVASRNVHAAIYDALRLCKDVNADREHPESVELEHPLRPRRRSLLRPGSHTLGTVGEQ